MDRRKFSILLLSIFLLLLIHPLHGEEMKAARSPLHQLSIPSYKVQAGGVEIHYVEAGKGPALIFLHGLGGSWKDWAANLPAFAAANRVVAIDFPGFGDSPQAEVEYSIEWLTDVVEKFIASRNLEAVNLVGHSLGGIVALNLAARPNSRVKRLAVADAVGIGDKTGFLSYNLTKKLMGPETKWESLEIGLQEQFKSMIESFIRGEKSKTAKEFFQSLPKSPFTGKPLLPMTPAVQLTASIIDFNIRPKLSSIRQPTLILWGERDPIAPPQDASLLQKDLPSSTLFMFPNCGHSPMAENPEAFNRELGYFLQGDSGTSK